MIELLSGVLEFGGYLLGFWLFIFSSAFRTRVLQNWRSRSRIGKFLIPIEVSVSVLCGLAPIGVLIWIVFRQRRAGRTQASSNQSATRLRSTTAFGRKRLLSVNFARGGWIAQLVSVYWSWSQAYRVRTGASDGCRDRPCVRSGRFRVAARKTPATMADPCPCP